MTRFLSSQITHAAIWTIAITAAHFVVGTHSASLHWFHVLLASLYLIPVMIAAVTFERLGGLVASVGVGLAYLAHLLWSWSDSPMANPDQYAWLGVYPVVGLITGHLVHTANLRKRQRDEVIARARHSEMVNGLSGLLAAVDARDAATVSHSQRVAAAATAIAERLGLERETVSRIHLAALVHDVGKAGIPDAVLFKHGPLETDQRATMREHVEIAVSMLRQVPGTEAISRLVAQHHECPDGSGYPNGLEAHEIDPAAAVLRVADVFVALTEARPYHDAMSSEDALANMEPSAGTALDARAYEALRRVLDETPMALEATPTNGGMV